MRLYFSSRLTSNDCKQRLSASLIIGFGNCLCGNFCIDVFVLEDVETGCLTDLKQQRFSFILPVIFYSSGRVWIFMRGSVATSACVCCSKLWGCQVVRNTVECDLWSDWLPVTAASAYLHVSPSALSPLLYKDTASLNISFRGFFHTWFAYFPRFAQLSPLVFLSLAELFHSCGQRNLKQERSHCCYSLW